MASTRMHGRYWHTYQTCPECGAERGWACIDLRTVCTFPRLRSRKHSSRRPVSHA